MTDENVARLEGSLEKRLKEIETLTPGSKERQAAVQDVRALVSALNETDSTMADWTDKQEKRRIDEEKNRSMAEIEKAKSDLTWKKILLELGKILIPSCISVWAYDKFQKRLLAFEETGRVNSTAGRELHLPKFFK